MFIYDKSKGYIVNVNEVKDIFLGRDRGTVAVGLRDGGTTKLRVYESEEEARTAIDMLAESIAVSKREIICMPTSEEIRVKLRNTPLTAVHHATGKKTKGHGGS